MLGSYSAARVDQAAARTTFAEPFHNRIYFAGEAISPPAHNSEPGAYLTGPSAATSIFDQIGTPRLATPASGAGTLIGLGAGQRRPLLENEPFECI